MVVSRLSWVVASLILGIALGVGGYTFVYAKGYSYLMNDPAACANCHIMGDHYNAWMKSAHRHVATCNDCHTPPGFIHKYLTKADNGFWHSVAFTTGRHPDPLRIKLRNQRVTEEACRKCHHEITDMIDPVHAEAETISCVRCHASVGHLD